MGSESLLEKSKLILSPGRRILITDIENGEQNARPDPIPPHSVVAYVAFGGLIRCVLHRRLCLTM